LIEKVYGSGLQREEEEEEEIESWELKEKEWGKEDKREWEKE